MTRLNEFQLNAVAMVMHEAVAAWERVNRNYTVPVWEHLSPSLREQAVRDVEHVAKGGEFLVTDPMLKALSEGIIKVMVEEYSRAR